MKKSIIILLIAVMLFAALPFAAFAADSQVINVTLDNATGLVKITGQTSTGAGREITVIVINPNKGIGYLNQMTSGTNGSYSFSYILPGRAVSGIYSVCVSGAGMSMPLSATFDYSKPPQNLPPVIEPVGNQAVDENCESTFKVTASDPNGDNVTMTASNLPRGAAFDNATETFSWKPEFTDAGQYVIEITASDGSLTAAADVTITVRNVSASELTADLTNDVKTLVTNKIMRELLVKELDNIRSSLDKKNYKLAMVKLKVFMNEIKALKKGILTVDKSEAVLKACVDICLAIKADAQAQDNKWIDKKVEQCISDLEKFLKGNITDKVYKDISDAIDALISKMK